MSDALCGPSNALQNFQKHASVDRTLQQDRIVSRQSPQQGFRSRDTNEGALDPEFAAFEANNIPFEPTAAGPPLPNVQHAGPFIPPNPQLSMAGPAANPDWAADFQNLQISGPSHPVPQHQHPSMAPMNPVASAGWQNEFMQHQQQHRPLGGQRPQAYRGFQPSFTPGMGLPLHGAAAPAVPLQGATAEHQGPTETFDESAFEAAFEQARADMETVEDVATNERVAEASHSDTAERELHEAELKIGSDNIPETKKEDSSAQRNNNDELAKTAGRLLDSVSHDQSQKFKESNFLALMRRIRDREVQVEGDDFREVSTNP